MSYFDPLMRLFTILVKMMVELTGAQTFFDRILKDVASMGKVIFLASLPSAYNFVLTMFFHDFGWALPDGIAVSFLSEY